MYLTGNNSNGIEKSRYLNTAPQYAFLVSRFDGLTDRSLFGIRKSDLRHRQGKLETPSDNRCESIESDNLPDGSHFKPCRVTCANLSREMQSRSKSSTDVLIDSGGEVPKTELGEFCLNNTDKSLYKLVAWVKKLVINRNKTGSYLEVVDGTTPMHVEVVIRDTHPSYAAVSDINVGDAITIVGNLEKKCSGSDSVHPAVQLVVTSEAKGHVFTHHRNERNQEETNPVALNGNYPLMYLREHCNFRVRNPLIQAIFRIRAKATEELFRILPDMGFVHVTAPCLTSINCEGMGEIFKGPTTFLSVSGQLELEALCSGISRVWKFGPAFRADRSDTPRHLSEFWMLEAEMNDVTLSELTDAIHTIVKRTASALLTECRDDLAVISQNGEAKVINRLQNLHSSALKTLTYSDAVNLLNNHKLTGRECEYEHINWGEPLTAAHERGLLKLLDHPMIAVTQYPASIMPFYMERLTNGTVNNVDVIADGVGEIAGGSIREVQYHTLKRAMQEHHIEGSEYDQYLELRKFGNVAHGGFGIGFERMLMFLLGINNIKEVIHFPKLRKKYTVK
ncbi:asparaginyl-tRNA synthetase, putative [Babesia bigemina]|uniref:Asparaginyl-tRNA synthetase, putative n=1 Tax=Babesia bigemina TaxID=5866 RepID=A0A061D650_BABBI|nr:asparaginyl-tRNA synthetase, putative [Babesia bigemina]CDR94399.1 asparaginyl-tRNA synthetase, putative [Babesia bigemina]|eukprot:XP_012766585.1 asparaginyl-tRNA synthetase, putative [Babesia bigemina]